MNISQLPRHSAFACSIQGSLRFQTGHFVVMFSCPPLIWNSPSALFCFCDVDVFENSGSGCCSGFGQRAELGKCPITGKVVMNPPVLVSHFWTPFWPVPLETVLHITRRLAPLGCCRRMTAVWEWERLPWNHGLKPEKLTNSQMGHRFILLDL